MLVLIFVLFIESFAPTWYSPAVRHSLWGWCDLWQSLKDWFDIGSRCSSGRLLAHSMNSAGLSRDKRLEVCARQGLLIPQPSYLMLLGGREHPLSAFRKASVYGRREVSFIYPKMPGVRIAQIDRPLLLLIWWSLGVSRSSLMTLPFSPMKPWCLWPFLVDLPMPQRESMLVLEKPTSMLNTKRVTCTPVPVISAFVSICSNVGLIATKYPLSSAFWMSLYKKNNSSHILFVPKIFFYSFVID